MQTINLMSKDEQVRMWAIEKAFATGDYEISNKELLKTAKALTKYVLKDKT